MSRNNLKRHNFICFMIFWQWCNIYEFRWILRHKSEEMKVSGCCICYILLYIYKWCQYLSFLVILLCRHEHFLLLMHSLTQNESSISLRLLLFVSITIKGDIIFFFWLIFLYRLGNWLDLNRYIFLKLTVPKRWQGDLQDEKLLVSLKCTAALSYLTEKTIVL